MPYRRRTPRVPSDSTSVQWNSDYIYSSVAQVDYAESVVEHEVVVDLVRAGDGTGAKAAIEAHWARASERTGRTFERLWPDRAPDTGR